MGEDKENPAWREVKPGEEVKESDRDHIINPLKPGKIANPFPKTPPKESPEK